MNYEEIQISLPQDFKQKLATYQWQEILIGCSESRVFRLTHPLYKTLFLKITADNDSSLSQEKTRLDWLQGKLPVPQPLMFSTLKGVSYFLMTEIPGTSAEEFSFQGNELQFIEQLAAGLQRIHSLPLENCPFDMRLDNKIKLAEERMKNGLVDEDDFDDERLGRTAESLFSELVQSRPVNEEPVFTHGDYCLPNIIFNENKLSGFIDMGNSGIADKYQDIALLARSLEYNFGAEGIKYLYEAINIKPDMEKIRFYTLLDEFF